MKRRPFFSIVIPTYNRSRDLRFALHCILRQRFRDYEIIVSDNCSTDDTAEVVGGYKHLPIRYYRNRTNIGLYGNQKKAMQYAKGTYVFLHGDDDFLLQENSLGEVYKKIVTYRPGYVRVNYASVSADKEHIFSYNVYKPFRDDYYLPPGQHMENVVSFIVDADSYFFSGIVFKNSLPKNISMVEADPSPWIAMLLYVTARYGGYFMHERHLIAVWSRRTRKSEDHGFYQMVDGKLKAEGYLDVVRKFVGKEAYRAFLHKELLTIYVNLFPAVKRSVGTGNFLSVARRVRALDPSMNRTLKYWLSFTITLLLPMWALEVLRDFCLAVYMRFSKVALQLPSDGDEACCKRGNPGK